jgi:CRP-like cAMP-binding protein
MGTWADLVRDISDDDIRAATTQLNTLSLGANEVLMAQGDADGLMVYLLHGHVEVSKDGVPIDTSGPGEILGMMSMLRRVPRTAQVRTTEPSKAVLLDFDGYTRLVADDNPVVFRLERICIEQMAQRLRRLNGLVGERSSGEWNRYQPPGQGFFDQLRALVGGTGDPLVEGRLVPAVSLAASRLFEGVDRSVIDDLSTLWEPVAFKKGRTLCQQGEEGGGLFLIGHGSADVYVAINGFKVHKMGSVGPGDAVGMTGVMDGLPRSATVIATEQVDALRLSKEHFDQLMAKDGQVPSALRRAVMRGFSDQMEEAGSNLVTVSPVADLLDKSPL